MIKNSLKLMTFLLLVFSTTFQLSAQVSDPEPEDEMEEMEDEIMEDDESSTPSDSVADDKKGPLDDVVAKRMINERFVLPYEHIREADIMWEKRIWRVLDTREKMNKPFSFPEAPFVKILMDAAIQGDIKVYGTLDDKFTQELEGDEVAGIGSSIDTIMQFDPETYEEKITIVRNEMDYQDIKRFRIKEVWFFDEESSIMKVRILGIAPLKDVKDENGNFRYEQPLFWVYYPDCRQLLASEKVYNPENDASPLTWEDIFEMRYFSSYIYKQSNVYNRRLKDYLSGVDLLLESDRIKNEIFNYEHDLWSY